MQRFTVMKTCSIFFFLFVIGVSLAHKKSLDPDEPCKRMVLYMHDKIYMNGTEKANATTLALTYVSLASNRFGLLAVFNDPMTKDRHLMSPPVARAQGFYLYDSLQLGNAFLSFSLIFNSSEYQGSLNPMGADILFNKTRDISVVGGTGDFFMTRGICTLQTDYVQGNYYFRLKLDIKKKKKSSPPMAKVDFSRCSGHGRSTEAPQRQDNRHEDTDDEETPARYRVPDKVKAYRAFDIVVPGCTITPCNVTMLTNLTNMCEQKQYIATL